MTSTPGVRGFTLVELMVTVLVVAVLAAIAYPAYTNQIRKSRRTEARTALLDLAAREERYFAVQNAYTSSAANLGYANFTSPVGSGYYTLAVGNVTAGSATTTPTFTLTATAVAGSGQDLDLKCRTFQVDQTGAQSSVDSSNVDSTATCWR